MCKNELLYRTNLNSIQLMQTKAENLLNPFRHHLFESAKKGCGGYILFIMKQIIILQERQIKLAFLGMAIKN